MTLPDRFWEKVDKNGPTQPHMKTCCWVWLSAKTKKGHGQFWLNGKTVLAHRIVWESVNGPLGELQALHACDNSSCVNPDHLFSGTAVDNVKDMDAKGRRVSREKLRQSVLSSRRRGADHPSAKLSNEQREEIRLKFARDGRSMRSLGREYNVGHHAVSAIVA